jgi:hypothetical protein
MAYKNTNTPDEWLALLKKNGCLLNFVPKDMMTPEMCWTAVQESGYALEFVPAGYKTESLCLMAVRNAGPAFAFVPIYLMTHEMVDEAKKADKAHKKTMAEHILRATTEALDKLPYNLPDGLRQKVIAHMMNGR